MSRTIAYGSEGNLALATRPRPGWLLNADRSTWGNGGEGILFVGHTRFILVYNHLHDLDKNTTHNTNYTSELKKACATTGRA